LSVIHASQDDQDTGDDVIEVSAMGKMPKCDCSQSQSEWSPAVTHRHLPEDLTPAKQEKESYTNASKIFL